MLRLRLSFAAVTVATLVSASTEAVAADKTASSDPTRADAYDPRIGILFVPTADVDAVPSTECPVTQGGADNAALNCVGGLTEDTTYAISANIDTILTGIETALAPYNVRVVTERPPEYVPYSMLIITDGMNPKSTSRTCGGAGIDCDGPNRNDIGITSVETSLCMDPDQLQVALNAFGYMSGLENNDNPMDPMFYPPDYMMPATEFQDMCSNVVPTLDEKDMENNLVCPGFVHERNCDMMDGQINSHVELLEVYGPAGEADTTPPEVTDFTAPEDGAVLPAGSPLEVSAMVTDDSNVVAARWVVSSPVLVGAPTAREGEISQCTNDVCDSNWEGNPFKPLDTPYDFALTGLPGGDYTVTFEASDLSGNTAEIMMRSFTIEGGAADTGADETTGDDAADDVADDANDDNADDDDGDSSGGDDDDDGNATGDDDGDGGGCSCTTDTNAGGSALLLFGFAGLAMTRRRRVG